LTNDNDPNNGYALVHAEIQVPAGVNGPDGTWLETLFWVGYGGYGSAEMAIAYWLKPSEN